MQTVSLPHPSQVSPSEQRGGSYTPNLSLFTEKRDIASFTNLEVWAKDLQRDFDAKIRPHLGSDAVYSEALEVFGNQLTLLLLLLGENERCVDYCHRIVRHYASLYQSRGDLRFVGKMVQPSINIARFFRLKRDMDRFWATLAKIDYWSRENIELGGQSFPKASIGDAMSKLLQTVSISERIKGLLGEGRYAEVLQLSDGLSQRKPLFYWEARVLAHITLQEDDAACSLILSLMKKLPRLERYMLYQRLGDLARRDGHHDEADAIYKQVAQEKCLLIEDPIFYSHILKQIQAPPKECVDAALQALYQRGDELHRGLLLLDVCQRGVLAYHDKLKMILAQTAYATLRRRSADFLVTLPRKHCQEAVAELGKSFDLVFPSQAGA